MKWVISVPILSSWMFILTFAFLKQSMLQELYLGVPAGVLNSSIALSGICYSFYWLISFILFHCLEKDIKWKDKSIRGSVYCTVIYIFLHDYVYIFSASLGIWRHHTFFSLPYLTANYHHCDDVFLRVTCGLQQWKYCWSHFSKLLTVLRFCKWCKI